MEVKLFAQPSMTSVAPIPLKMTVVELMLPKTTVVAKPAGMVIVGGKFTPTAVQMLLIQVKSCGGEGRVLGSHVVDAKQMVGY